jgi:prefoldin subunit 5
MFGFNKTAELLEYNDKQICVLQTQIAKLQTTTEELKDLLEELVATGQHTQSLVSLIASVLVRMKPTL